MISARWSDVIVHEIIYYEENNKSLVVEFLKRQNPKHQAKILREIDLLEEFGLSLGLPHIRKIINYGLWELRIKYSSNIFRILFTVKDNKFILIHGFPKKTDKISKREINIALKRLKNI